MAQIDILEQVWKEDMERMAEDTLALWQTIYRFWQRTSAQGAPPGLLEELVKITEQFREVHHRLAKVSVYFPEAEK